MALVGTTFEGTTVGDTLTATNGGTGNSPFAIGTTTLTPTSVYSSTTPIHGTRGWRLTCAAGANNSIYYSSAVTSSFSVAFGYKVKAQPTIQGCPIYGLIEGTSFNTCLTILAGTAGSVSVRNAAGTIVVMAGVTMAIDTTYRFEAWGSLAGTPTISNATYTVECYAGDSTTALGSVVVTGTGNLGTVGFVRNRIGKIDTAGTVDSIFDDFRSNLGSASPLGPIDVTLASQLALSPSSGVIPALTTATITATGGTGSPLVYAMDWGDGNTSAAQSSNTFTHTYAAAGSWAAQSSTQNS